MVSVAPPTGWIGIHFGADGVGVGFGMQIGTPVVLHRQPPIEDHHHRGPPAWGHYKGDPHFPGNNGGGKPGKGKPGKGGKHK